MFTITQTQHRRCRSITSFTNAHALAAAANNSNSNSNATTTTSSPGGGGMTVLSIMVTAHRVTWKAVEDRIASHPFEVRQLDDQGRTVLLQALSRRVDDYPSSKIIRLLLEADPSAVWEGVVDLCSSSSSSSSNSRKGSARATNNKSPLKMAALRRARVDILQSLTRGRPSVPSQDMEALVDLWNSYRDQYQGSEEALVQKLMKVRSKEASMMYAKLHCLLRYCTTPGKQLYLLAPRDDDNNNNGGGSTLHRAASVPEGSTNLLPVMLHQFPELVRQSDTFGRLPLHCLLLKSSTTFNPKELRRNQLLLKLDRLQRLLERYPEATQHRDSVNGQLPLHIAIASGWGYPHLGQLLQAFPGSLSELDEATGLYPFQLAAAAPNTSLTTIFTLLLGAPALVTKRLPAVVPTITDNNASEVTLNNSRISAPLFAASTRRERVANATTTLPFERSSNQSVIPDELKALLKHVKNLEDDELWHELQKILRSESSTTTVTEEWFALHAAVTMTECPIGLIRVLVHRYPEQLVQPDQRLGRTPLHHAAANSTKSLLMTTPPIPAISGVATAAVADEATVNANGCGNNADAINADGTDQGSSLQKKHANNTLRYLRLQAVLHGNPLAAQIPDHAGRLPLHLAAAAQGMPVECLESLIQAWPSALCHQDDQGMYPFLLAAASSSSSSSSSASKTTTTTTASLDKIFLLLLRAPQSIISHSPIRIPKPHHWNCRQYD